MNVTELRTPGAILFGIGACEKLTERLNDFSRGPVVLVTDPGLVKAGVADRVIRLVTAGGWQVSLFDGVNPDPDTESVLSCLKIIRQQGAAIVIGLGGGSALDVAKVAAMLDICGGAVADYIGVGRVPQRGLPTLLIPTTAGTGSEVSPIAVISDKAQHLKLGIVSPHLYGSLALVDPMLTVSCPPKVTAASGMDALTHAIEIYTNRFASPLIDPLVLESIQLAGRHLARCVREGTDIRAREGMALAALYAGLGLGPVNTAAVHALAYPLGAMFDVPHGLANSVLLPYVMEFNWQTCEAKYARIGEALGVSADLSVDQKAKAAVAKVAALSQAVGIPRSLKEIGIPETALPEMAQAAMKVTRLLQNNPRELTLADAEVIYRRAFG
ncbi:MAG: iron-containing alcohol dehydrogenase [Kiritimatiellae bacterium]|nr:iron-containing alcohol dehydrogenase [Kiritimatiellia bacterium]